MTRKGFTLIELIVAVTVMVILMGIGFSLMRAGDDAVARSVTRGRLQRMQNCLTGYYAAFGHYPPVPLQGSRDYRLKVDNYGIQTDAVASEISWRNVRAALFSQPVTVEFPFDAEDAFVAEDVAADSALEVRWGKAAKKTGEPIATAVLSKGFRPFAASMVSSAAGTADWRQVQAFRHGLLSWLLPSAQFLLHGEPSVYGLVQWTANHDLAEYYDAESGKPLANDWSAVVSGLRQADGSFARAVRETVSQAACARWLPNLAGIVRGGGTYYGVDTSDGNAFRFREHGLRDAESQELYVHAPGGPATTKTSQQYVLDGMTVLDGWEHEFYYYSPAPHRACRIWSGGPDGRTFPPWVDPQRAEADPKLKAALEWTRDDLVVELH